MSTFKLFTASGKTFSQIMLINKVIIPLSMVLVVLLLIILVILDYFVGIEINTWFTFIFYGAWFLAVIVLGMVTKRLKNKLEAAGELSVTTSAIRKTTGGADVVYEFRRIYGIKIEMLLKKTAFPSNKDGSQAYLVDIETDNGKTDRLIVSSQSHDKPEVNFLDTIKLTEKRLNLKLVKRD